MNFLRGMLDDLRHLDSLLFSNNPLARLRGLMLGVLIILGSATATFVVTNIF